MGPRDGVEAFAPDDSFLRRIDKKRHALDGIIAADVFRPRTNETTLSFTYQDASLRQEGALAAYQLAKRLPSGDLPGICRLTFHDLTRKLDPPLPPFFPCESRPWGSRSYNSFDKRHQQKIVCGQLRCRCP